MKSSITYYKLQIFRVASAPVYEEESDPLPANAQNGIDISTFQWDGTLNGQLVLSETYSYIATIKSCYSGINLEGECTLADGLQTGNQSEVKIVGTVDVIY